MAKGDSDREQRLAEALRANLHRRKAQSRERTVETLDDKARRHGSEEHEVDA